MTAPSPLAPKHFPNLLAVAGVRLASAGLGLRYQGRDDVVLVELAPGTAVAGVLTRSTMPSAPVLWCRGLLSADPERRRARALVVNAGQANAFTGPQGLSDAQTTAKAAAQALGGDVGEIYLASTGVIGEQLPVERLSAALSDLAEGLATGGWERAANAIRTTDTFAKGACRIARIDGHEVVIDGIAKGSGMIQPDMATMLAFLFTNAAIAPAALQDILAEINNRTFNAISVDGDTSTSDTVLAFATGVGAGHQPVGDAADPRLGDFRGRLEEVMTDLAQQIVRDGEGASKFVTITVDGAENETDARRIAFAVANSPLVKTAIAGGDANWGRIVMAVGKSRAHAEPEKLRITIGGQTVAIAGAQAAAYDEAAASRHFKGCEIDIGIDLGAGSASARVWTCDLTARYIEINADYRS